MVFPRGLNFRRHRLLLIFVVALAVRLIAVSVGGGRMISDAEDHWQMGFERARIARSLVLGQGFASPFIRPSGPTAWAMPLYPVLLAVVFKLAGIYSHTARVTILVMQALLSALCTIPIFLVSKRVFDDGTANLAAWLWAFFPPAIEFSYSTVSEAHVTALLFSCLLLVVYWLEESPLLGRWLWAGLFLGLAVQTAEILLPLGIFFLFWVWHRHRSSGLQAGKGLTLACALVVVAMIPWTVRNALTFHHFIPLRSNAGLELYVGNGEGASGQFSTWTHPFLDSLEFADYRTMGEIAYVADRQRRALAWISGHPRSFATLTGVRFLRWWSGGTLADHSTWFSRRLGLLYHPVFYSCLSVLAWAGVYLARKRRGDLALPLLLSMAVFPLPYYVFHVASRYRLPMEPVMVMLAACAATFLFRQSRLAGRLVVKERSKDPSSGDDLPALG